MAFSRVLVAAYMQLSRLKVKHETTGRGNSAHIVTPA